MLVLRAVDKFMQQLCMSLAKHELLSDFLSKGWEAHLHVQGKGAVEFSGTPYSTSGILTL